MRTEKSKSETQIQYVQNWHVLVTSRFKLKKRTVAKFATVQKAG